MDASSKLRRHMIFTVVVDGCFIDYNFECINLHVIYIYIYILWESKGALPKQYGPNKAFIKGNQWLVVC